MLFSPLVLITFLPLLIVISNRPYKETLLPSLESWLQIGFFIAWFLIGIFYINGGDTQESVGSLFTKSIGASGNSGLISLSGNIMLVACVVSATLLFTIVLRAESSRRAVN